MGLCVCRCVVCVVPSSPRAQSHQLQSETHRRFGIVAGLDTWTAFFYFRYVETFLEGRLYIQHNSREGFNYSYLVKRANMCFSSEQEQGGQRGKQEIPCEDLMGSWRLNRHNRGRWRGQLLEVEEGKMLPWHRTLRLWPCLLSARAERAHTWANATCVHIHVLCDFKNWS